MIEGLAPLWGNALFAIVAALAWLSASFVSGQEASAEFVSEAGVEITAAMPSPEPILVSIEDDDRELQEDDLGQCGLPGVLLVSRPALNLSQITPPRSLFLSVLTPAQRPLRC